MKLIHSTSIQTRLLISFVAMALLLAIGISSGSVIVGYLNGKQQAIDRLESIAARQKLELITQVRDLQNQLRNALDEKYSLERASLVLELASQDKYYDFFSGAVRQRFQRVVQNSPVISELFLLDRLGVVVLSTDETRQQGNYVDERFFTNGLVKPAIQFDKTDGKTESDFVFIAIPVLNTEHELVGVLAARANPAHFINILNKSANLENSISSYLVNEDHYLLFNPKALHGHSQADEANQKVNSKGIDDSLKEHANLTGVFRDYRGNLVVGVYHWVDELDVSFVAEQPTAKAFQGIYLTLGVNLGIAMFGLLAAVIAARAITRSISRPLVDLAEIATRIAQGDLNCAAPPGRSDEIGVVAKAFNSMTAQLRDMINKLEERVAERTTALQKRAIQLETTTWVSKEITSILNIDELLSSIEKIIEDAFGYDDARVYLKDVETNMLALASSGKTVDAQHKYLPIDASSLNGIAVQKRDVVLINDVTKNPSYLVDEKLPDIHSELIIPLAIGERIIGTLDVSSSRMNAFAPEDVQILQLLSDQMAVAIENASLYNQSQKLAILEERNRLARELHDSVAQSLFSIDLSAKAIATNIKRQPQTAETEIDELRRITHDATQEMRALIYNLRPVSLGHHQGLVAALRSEIERLSKADGPRIRLQAVNEIRLPETVEQSLFRVAQEVLHNSLKHAAPQNITLKVDMSPTRVKLVVADDGCGFDAGNLPYNKHSFGIIGMRERVELLNGVFNIHSRPGEGTMVEVEIPI